MESLYQQANNLTLNMYKDLHKIVKIQNNLINLLEENKTDTEYKKSIDIFMCHLNEMTNIVLSRHDRADTYSKEIEKSADYLFKNKNKNTYILPDLLSDLRMCLPHNEIDRMHRQYKVNFYESSVETSFLAKYYKKNFLIKLKSISDNQSMDNLLENFEEFLKKQKISTQTSESFCNNSSTILTMTYKYKNKMKITDKDFKDVFASIWAVESLTTKKIFIDDFIKMFVQSNTFNNTLAPMKKLQKPLMEYFNVNSMPRVGKKNEDEEFLNYFLENKTIMALSLDKKLENADKLRIFGKITLNEKDSNLLEEQKKIKEETIKKINKI